MLYSEIIRWIWETSHNKIAEYNAHGVKSWLIDDECKSPLFADSNVDKILCIFISRYHKLHEYI